MAKKSFKIKGGLAEALGDTVTSAKNNAGELHIEVIPLRKIELDPENPREFLLTFEDLYQKITGTTEEQRIKNLEKESLSSITSSIEEQGVINPIVVYKYSEQYRLIAGERRTLASMMAKKADIPARVLTKRPTSLELSLIQWVENMEREDLTLWERSRNLVKILEAYAQKTNRTTTEVPPVEISQLLNCSLQQAINYRNILNASPELKKHIQSGKIKNIDKAAFISKSPEEMQSMLIQACLNGNTLSEMKKMVKEEGTEERKLTKGRPTKKINFGSTTSHNTAKIILKSIIDNQDLQKYTSDIGEVVWDDIKSITNAFRRVIKLLEQA